MIQVAVALGIADSLHDGPKPATKLVTDSGADANMVLRLCRALSAFGIFEVDSEDMVSQSARSAVKARFCWKSAAGMTVLLA